ncbi:MAG: winged helix-turn-helix domain-containing protein [Halovenus sp.]
MPSEQQVDWDAVSHVTASQYRQAAVQALVDGPATPTGITEDTGHDIAHISRSLQNLREEDIVELLVSEDRRKGRYYGLTEHGERVADRVAEVTA